MPSKNIVDFANQIKTYMRGAEVVEGKNLCFASLVQGVISGGDGSYIPDRTANVCITDFIPITAGVSYVLSCTTSISGKTCLFSPQFYSGASEASYISGLSWTDSGASFTAITGATHLRFSIKLNDSSNFTPSSISNLMLCTQAEWTRSHTYEPYYVPVKDRDKIKRGTFTATITGQGSLTNAQYCIIDKVCFVYLAITLTENWQGGDGNIILTTNLPKRTNIDLAFGGVYGYPTINCYSHSDGRISFHIISGSIPANSVIMASICFPID